MKIAQVAPLMVSVPPKGYGGTERIVSYLTEALVELGHDVTLFAAGGSETAGSLIPIGTEPLWAPGASSTKKDVTLWHSILLDTIMDHAKDFDIIHFHTDIIHLPIERFLPCPSLATFHNRLNLPDYDKLFEKFPRTNVVSISDNHQSHLPNLNWQGTVHHGLPKNLYTFHEEHQGYFAFVGRINKEKGPDDAIRIAIELDTPIKIAAKIEDQAFYDRHRDLFEHPLVEFVGEVTDEQKNDFIGNAKALLFPIKWPEPFGLVMIEAMACGTPVIAYNKGSVPEVIKSGLNGFVVKSEYQAIEAALQLHKIDRHACRVHFEHNFTSEIMAEEYVKLYEQLIRYK